MNYQERVYKWIAGRTFRYVNPIVLDKGKATCDVCDTKLCKIFYVVQDIKTEQTFMVGKECFSKIPVLYSGIKDQKQTMQKHLIERKLL